MAQQDVVLLLNDAIAHFSMLPFSKVYTILNLYNLVVRSITYSIDLYRKIKNDRKNEVGLTRVAQSLLGHSFYLLAVQKYEIIHNKEKLYKKM